MKNRKGNKKRKGNTKRKAKKGKEEEDR